MWFESNLPNIPTYRALVHISRQFGAIKLSSFLMSINQKSPTVHLVLSSTGRDLVHRTRLELVQDLCAR